MSERTVYTIQVVNAESDHYHERTVIGPAPDWFAADPTPVCVRDFARLLARIVGHGTVAEISVTELQVLSDRPNHDDGYIVEQDHADIHVSTVGI